MSGVIGQDVSRLEGPAKVTGPARYTGEITLPGLAYAEIVGATVASGRVTSIGTAAAEQAEGVAAVLTQRDMPKVGHVPLLPSLLGGPAPGETFFPMQDDVVHYAGQPVAIVVADSLEQAQHAATLVRVSYAGSASVTTIGQGREDAYEPEKIFGGVMPAQVHRGNAEDGLAERDSHRPGRPACPAAGPAHGDTGADVHLVRAPGGAGAAHRARAARDGRLTAIRHHKISITSPFDDWAEPAFGVASALYASPAFEGVHHLVRGNTMTPTFTRGPGETLGVFTLECAMDELASELGIDPIELRLRNLTETDPNTGNPWSSYGLRECFERGAARFGWAGRDPRPRSERDGNWLIGTGMATAGYPVAFFMRTQRARAHLYSDGTAIVATAAQEFGTGAVTALTQVAADALGTGLRDVRLDFGDTDLPAAGSPVGSNGAMMVSAAVHNAATAVRDQLIALAAGDPRSPLHGADPAKITITGGRMTLAGDASTGETYGSLMQRHLMNDAEAIGSWDPPPLDTRSGRWANASLGDYLVPVNADAPGVDVELIEVEDPIAGPLGVKGVGEIGQVGAAAAIANAVYHATGYRARELPIAVEHLLPHLPRQPAAAGTRA